MKKFSGICAAAAVVAATMLQGCLPTPLHTQQYAAGEMDLQGKQVYLSPSPGASGYTRTVVDITTLPNDPADDATTLDVSGGSATVDLGGDAISFFGTLFDTIVVGADGTIGMGEAGDNSSLATHFAVKEVSLLPVEAIGTGTVSLDVSDFDFVTVTFDGVTAGGAAAVAQAEFFINTDMYGDIALNYETISTQAAGIVGLSNGPLAGADQATIDAFLADFANQGPLSTSTMTGT